MEDIGICSALIMLIYWKKTYILFTYININTAPLSVIRKEVFLDTNAEKNSIFPCLVNRRQDNVSR
jgi:hypothetical protein